MNALRGRRWWLAAAAGAAAVMLGGGALAQVSGGSYNLSWSALLGGGTSTNAPYSVQGVIGQPVAGRASQAPFAVDSGFIAGAIQGNYRRIMPNLSNDGLY